MVLVIAAGKSSLLAALLGEMEQHCGHMRVQGRVAYAPQQPWILTGTLRWEALPTRDTHLQPAPLHLQACMLLARMASMLSMASLPVLHVA